MKIEREFPIPKKLLYLIIGYCIFLAVFLLILPSIAKAEEKEEDIEVQTVEEPQEVVIEQEQLEEILDMSIYRIYEEEVLIEEYETSKLLYMILQKLSRTEIEEVEEGEDLQHQYKLMDDLQEIRKSFYRVEEEEVLDENGEVEEIIEHEIYLLEDMQKVVYHSRITMYSAFAIMLFAVILNVAYKITGGKD